VEKVGISAGAENFYLTVDDKRLQNGTTLANGSKQRIEECAA
jgi:hypothetical protein